MAAKKTLSADPTNHSAVGHAPSAYGRLHAFLHTVRCIAQYEDVLCEITHDMKQSGTLSPSLSRELDEILDRIPSSAYVSDLNAVREILVDTPMLAKSGLVNSVKARQTGRNAAKNSGRPSSK